MNYLLIFVFLISSLNGFAQQTPDEILHVFEKDYYPTITQRHKLFLLEYNKTRLIDYIMLHKHNTDKINAVTNRFSSLVSAWRPLVKSGTNHSADLPLLASMKLEAGNLRREMEEAVMVISSIADSLPSSCSENTLFWMDEKFLPTKIYQVPHYQFTGNGADNNLNITFQVNYSTSFGGSSHSARSGSTQTGNAQIGDGSKDATAFAAVGMVAGVAVGSLAGPAGSQIGGYIGLAIGTAVGTIISSAKKMREANRAYQETKDSFHAINETLSAAHLKLDGFHAKMVRDVCSDVFNNNANTILTETNSRAQEVLRKINSEVFSIEREWQEIKGFHIERLQNHQMFLELVMEGYEINFEKRLESVEQDLLALNARMKKYYVSEILPKLDSFEADDFNANDELIGILIQGEAEFNHADYQSYTWKAISEKINDRLGVK